MSFMRDSSCMYVCMYASFLKENKISVKNKLTLYFSNNNSLKTLMNNVKHLGDFLSKLNDSFKNNEMLKISHYSGV